jgi:hypothetical protein
MAKVRKGITFKATHQFLNALFSEDVHAKRVYSLANATLGVISSASLAVNTIGQGLALERSRAASFSHMMIRASEPPIKERRET